MFSHNLSSFPLLVSTTGDRGRGDSSPRTSPDLEGSRGVWKRKSKSFCAKSSNETITRSVPNLLQSRSEAIRPCGHNGSLQQSHIVVLNWHNLDHNRRVTTQITILYEKDPEGGYTASIPEVPGAISQGDTVEAARDNVLDALQELLAFRREQAMKNPESRTETFPVSISISA